MQSVIIGLSCLLVVVVTWLRRNLWTRGEKIRTTVVLGPGGHSREMLEILKLLDPGKYVFSFIHPAGSTHFIHRILEEVLPTCSHTSGGKGNSEVVAIPSTHPLGIFPVRAFFHSFLAMVSLKSDLIITNGPGIAVPVCLATRIVNLLLARKTRIIYIESMCRVDSFSKTGKILYPLVDKFVVLWPNLAKRNGVVYLGE